MKSTSSGLVPPDFVRSESCEVYSDRVVVTRHYGPITLEETKRVTLTGDIAKVISKASGEETTETGTSPCDGPTTFIAAGDTVLYFSGSCGSPTERREGPASEILRDIVDNYCPQTI